MKMKLFFLLYLLVHVNEVRAFCSYTDLGREADISPSAKDTPACKNVVGAKVGCTLRYRCNPGNIENKFGYYLARDTTGAGIDITCNNNNKWVVASNKAVIPTCVKGCVVLTNTEMANATYSGIGRPTEIYRNGAIQFWPLDTVVRTVCKEGYVFHNIKHEENKEDNHRCTEKTGWFDVVTSKENSYPAVCRAICEPLDARDIPNNVKIMSNPLTFSNYVREYHGRKVLISGSTYQFKCADGYKYSSPHSASGFQYLTCTGGKNAWYDPDTRTNSASPKSCMANGCPMLSNANIVRDAVFSYEGPCSPNSGVVGNGCTAIIRCNTNSSGINQGFYMKTNPNGYALSCKEGQWKRPDGSNAQVDGSGRYGETCISGCSKLTSAQQQSTNTIQESGSTSRNGEFEYHHIGNTMITSCKDGYIRPNIPNQNSQSQLTYVCRSDGWKNADDKMNDNGNMNPASCTKSCEITYPSPVGTKLVTNAVIVNKSNKNFVQSGSVVTVTCENGYRSPDPNDNQNKQVLSCLGNTEGWKNTQTGNTNSVPMTCVRDGSQGCTLVNTQTYPNSEIIYNNDCSEKEGLTPEGCSLTIRCKEGYAPDNSQGTSPTGDQKLVCKAGTDGFVDANNNNKNVQPLKCLPACSVIKNMETAIYTKSPSNTIHYGSNEYLMAGAEVTIKCKTPEYDINNHADKVNGNEITYKCLGGSDRYMKLTSYRYNTIPGDACSGVCKGLEGTESPGTLLTPVYKADSMVYERDGQRFVVNMEYTAKCASGYEFPKNSPQATRGQQRLACSSLSMGYRDMDTNQTNVQLASCVRSELPKCPALDTTINKISITQTGSQCGQEPRNVGCELSLRCMNGSYSTNTKQNSQKISCTTDSQGNHKWISEDENYVISCALGCSSFQKDGNFIIVLESSSTLEGTIYYKEASEVIVSCSSGRFPTLHSGVHRTESTQFAYVCLPGEVSEKNWRNVISQRFETHPGSLCGLPCSALNTDGKGLDVVSRPEEFGMAQVQVVGESSYTLRCKPGHSYSSTAHQQAGQQILFCDPKSGTYIDRSNNNKTEATIQTCTMDSGSGCPDITVPNGDQVFTNCESGYNNGCKVTISCKEGYIPTNSKFYSTGKQVLTCSNGISWTDENGQSTSTFLQCQAACRLDSTVTNPNAVATWDNTKVHIVNNIVYILEGENVMVQCQGDNVIWELNTQETRQNNTFECRGGTSGYVRKEDYKQSVQLGDGCVQTCPRMTHPDLASLNLKVTNPPIIEYNNKELVVNGREYSFSCLNDFVYPNQMQSEKFRCDGNTQRYVNSINGLPYTTPTSCERSAVLDECLKLVQNPENVMESLTGCSDLGNNYYASGCRINLKCKPGYMPESALYFVPSGEQQIVCSNGGAGWKDQFDYKVTTGLKCISGCKPYDRSHESIRIREKTFYINGLKIECKEIDVFSNQTSTQSHPYYCDPTDSKNGTTDKGCTNACRQLVALPSGVEIFKEPEPRQLEEGFPYVAGNSQYVFRCRTGFVYSSSSAHRQLGRQTLQCDPQSNQYIDVDTKQTNANIEACEEAKGCQRLSQPNNILETVGDSGCTKNNDFFNHGCTIRYSCASGYYPDNLYALYNGYQVATCSESQQSWLDHNEQKLNSITNCIAGCANLNISQIVELKSSSSETIYETYYDSSRNGFQCYSKSIYSYVNEVIEQISKSGKNYICPKTNQTAGTSVSGNRENFCKDACPVISYNKLPEGVQFLENPITLNPYNNGEFIGVNRTVILRCIEGYEYSSASAYASVGIQEFVCQSSLNYYDNQLKRVNSIIEPCKKVLGAPAPPGSNVDREVDENCEYTEGIYKIGCKMRITCVEGSHPTNHQYYQMPEQNLELIMDPIAGPVWVDSITRLRVEYLSCTMGCLPISVLNSNITTSTLELRYGTIFVNCSQRTEEHNYNNLPEETKRYFCDGSSSNSSTPIHIPCTNSCLLPKYDNTLSIRLLIPLSPPFSQYFVRTTYLTVTCPSGKNWPDNNQSTRKYLCEENNQVVYIEDPTKKHVSNIQDTCV